MSEAGIFEYSLPDGDAVETIATKQCVHCGVHWAAKPVKPVTKVLTDFEAQHLQRQGRTVRGFCVRCNGPICGPKCVECNGGIERQLDIDEGSVDPSAVSVFIAASWADH